MKNIKPKKVIQKAILNPQDIRGLKSKLHHLKPVIIIGNHGLTDAVIQETDRALNDHELIKIRANSNNKEEFITMAKKICTDTQAILIQTIGRIIAIYRKNLQLEE